MYATLDGFALTVCELLLPPLLLLRPKYGKKSSDSEEDITAPEEQGQSSRCIALTFTFIGHALFRYTSDAKLLDVRSDNWVPLLTCNMPESAGLQIVIFWYLLMLALVWASYPDRPHSAGVMLQDKIRRMLVPEVLALFLFCGADAAMTIVSDVDKVDDGSFQLVRFTGNVMSGVLGTLPRLWFLLNLTLLISATIVGGISPPRGTARGVVFDFLWPVVMMQVTAMLIHRSATRIMMVQTVLQHDVFLACSCGLSVLFFTHIFTMAIAIIFRSHEHLHEVPSMLQILHRLGAAKSSRGVLAIWALCSGWFVLGNHLEPGMMETWYEEILIAVLSGAALAVAIANLARVKPGRSIPSLESNMVLCMGSVASLVWWSMLQGPDSLQHYSHSRTAVIILCTVTHIVLTFLFADVFAGRMDPPPHHCLFLTFWAGAMLFIGLKLEHHTAVEHFDHHRAHMLKWECLEHLGEFALCEFGLVSTVAWLTHLAGNADRWLDSEAEDWWRERSERSERSLDEPLLRKVWRKAKSGPSPRSRSASCVGLGWC